MRDVGFLLPFLGCVGGWDVARWACFALGVSIMDGVELQRRYAQGDRDFAGIFQWKPEGGIQALDGACFWGANLAGGVFSALSLRDCDLRQCDLRNCDLRDCDLRGANLRGANLMGAIVDGVLWQGAIVDELTQFSHEEPEDVYKLAPGANLAGKALRSAILEGADLRDADCGGADLTQTEAFGVNLGRANLRGTIADRGRWVEANLAGARLNQFQMREGRLDGAVLVRALLLGADLMGCFCAGTQWQGAVYDDRTCLPESLQNPEVEGLIKIGPGRSLRGVNLSEMDLTGVDLREADLWGADLWGANLWGADLSGANLTEANLTGANFMGARMVGACLDHAEQENTNLVEAIWE